MEIEKPLPADAPARTDPLFQIAEDAEKAFPEGTPEDGAAAEPGAAIADAGVLDGATVELLLSMPFDFIAARNGAHWKLTPAERAALVPVATRVANKYSPALLAKWADEAALATVLVVILYQRVQVDNELKAKKAEAAKAAPTAAA
jgi:hypothetical protein